MAWAASSAEPPRAFDPATIPAARTLRDVAYGPHERHRLDIDFPARALPGPLPVVVWVHGGAWRMSDKRGGSARRLLPHGYAVVSVNYRYATDVPFPAQIEDVQRAVRWIRAHAAEHGLDPKRIGAWGGSAGGHLVALLGTAPDVFPPAVDDPHGALPATVRAVCAINPVTDFARWDEQMPADADHPADWYAAPLFGGTIAARAELAQRASPLAHVSARAAAFLIVHGDRDRVVPPRQAVSLHEALRAAGVESTLHLIPGADHGGPAFSAGVPQGGIVAFFDRHLRDGRSAPTEVSFERLVLSSEYLSDGINAADIDRDGHPDVIAGPYCYRGPDFLTRRSFFPPVVHETERSPTDSLFTFPHDFDGDGWIDLLVLGRVLHHEAFWYRNPGAAGLSEPAAKWERHFVANRIFGESPHFADLDGDGHPELLSCFENRWGWFEPRRSEPKRPWRFVPITEPGDFAPYYHGQGIGDIDGDGRTDLVLNEGWWSQPPPGGPPAPWRKHEFLFSDDKGGAQMLVVDVNADGLADVITAKNAHGWGLSWFEQVRGPDGGITFREHRIMGSREEEAEFGVAFSQPHALALGDLDGDGLPDVVTGKRRWAHGPRGDVEPMGTPVNYVFLLRRDPTIPGGAKFVPKRIDDASGLGVQIAIADMDGDAVPDVLTASKLGAFLFFTRRK